MTVRQSKLKKKKISKMANNQNNQNKKSEQPIIRKGETIGSGDLTTNQTEMATIIVMV